MKATQGIMETAIYVRDLEAAEKFYCDVFGLEVILKVKDTLVFLRSGQSILLIFDPEKSSEENDENPIPRHGAFGESHFCFYAENADEVGRWRDRFVGLGIAIERYHIWQGTGAHSVYIRDPGNNSVEVGERKIWGLD